ERGRDERCRRNRQPYADRGREKQDRTSVTNRRYDRLVTEPRQEIDIGEIADEDRHQPDRAGARHHQYVAQQRARDEYRPLGGPDYGLDICHYSLSARACRARAYYVFLNFAPRLECSRQRTVVEIIQFTADRHALRQP